MHSFLKTAILPAKVPWKAAALTLIAAAVFLPGLHPCKAAPPSVRTWGGLAVSQSAVASEVGARILRRGGNAVDAAVAVAFALAVTHPAAGNIGGGGFAVVRTKDGCAFAFDFRECAPRAAREDMFLDETGKYDPDRHHWSLLSVGVPGTVAGLELLHRRLGRLPWPELVEPARRLAADGFEVTPGLAASLRRMIPRFRKHPPTLAQFTRDGEPYRPGDTLRQPDLARTLERIRDRGAAGFYRGETARLIVEEMRRGGGLITCEDLENYRAVERNPLRADYRGCGLITMPPPSSGGVALIQMLHILEGYDLKALGLRSAPETHLLIEAMRRAFADRARWLGDPDFVEIPLERLLSREYAAHLRRTIDPRRASRSDPRRFEWPEVGGETTHLSVVDAERTAVSLTTTLEQSYGLGRIVPGAGFLLNNEMGDFNPKRGLTTEDGLIGTPPNLAAPGKRMLSSMTPAIFVREGEPLLVLGSPGGRTIINTVLEVAVNFLDHGLSLQRAIDEKRFHHQWLPDAVFLEKGCLRPQVRSALEAMGHRLVERDSPQGSVMAISRLADGRLEAGVDKRRPDAGAASDWD